MTTTRVEARFSPPQLSRFYHLLEMNQGNVLDHFHDVYLSEIAVYYDQIGYQIGTIDETGVELKCCGGASFLVAVSRRFRSRAGRCGKGWIDMWIDRTMGRTASSAILPHQEQMNSSYKRTLE